MPWDTRIRRVFDARVCDSGGEGGVVFPSSKHTRI